MKLGAFCIPFAVLMTVGTAWADQPANTPAQAPATEQQPAVTTGPSTTAPAQNAQAASDGDKVVCRREPVPGTRIGAKKVCKTKREWAQLTRDSQDMLRDIDNKSGSSNPTTGKGS